MNETKTPLTNDFLQSLNDIMRAKDIKRTELAKHLGVRKQLVQSWLQANKKRCPSSEKLLMIQKWLKSLQ